MFIVNDGGGGGTGVVPPPIPPPSNYAPPPPAILSVSGETKFMVSGLADSSNETMSILSMMMLFMSFGKVNQEEDIEQLKRRMKA